MGMRQFNVLAFSVVAGWQPNALAVVIHFITAISTIRSQNGSLTRLRKVGKLSWVK